MTIHISLNWSWTFYKENRNKCIRRNSSFETSLKHTHSAFECDEDNGYLLKYFSRCKIDGTDLDS